MILPVGSTENHGKHMPLGTDTLLPCRIAELIEKRLDRDILILPALPYAATQDLVGFPGTLSIGIDGLELILSRICDQLLDYGFRRIIVLNGNGGNAKAIETVGLKVYRKGALLCRVDWWLLAGQLDPLWRGGHGGAEETRGVMAFDDALIKREYLELGEETINDISEELPYASWTSVSFKGGTVAIPRPIKNITKNGWLAHGIAHDEPFRATREEGQRMLEATADYVADLCGALERAPLPTPEK